MVLGAVGSLLKYYSRQIEGTSWSRPFVWRAVVDAVILRRGILLPGLALAVPLRLPRQRMIYILEPWMLPTFHLQDEAASGPE